MEQERDCVSCKAQMRIDDSKLQTEIFNEEKKLRKEINNALDAGKPSDEVEIELINRLWKMREDEVDRKSPQYQALEKTVDSYYYAVAGSYYRSKGWVKKHSGEWVRKEDLKPKPEPMCEDPQKQLDRLLRAGFWERRKILKELRRKK